MADAVDARLRGDIKFGIVSEPEGEVAEMKPTEVPTPFQPEPFDGCLPFMRVAECARRRAATVRLQTAVYET